MSDLHHPTNSAARRATFDVRIVQCRALIRTLRNDERIRALTLLLGVIASRSRVSIRKLSRVEPADTVNQGKIDRTEPRLLAKNSLHGEIRAHSDDTQRPVKGQEKCSTFKTRHNQHHAASLRNAAASASGEGNSIRDKPRRAARNHEIGSPTFPLATDSSNRRRS